MPLGEVLRINRSTLERGKAYTASPEVIEPFAYDIAESLLSITDQLSWRSRWQRDTSLPKDEEALIDFFMQMNICELLDFLVPLMRDESDES